MGAGEINDAATPKTLTLHFETGPASGNTNYGIHEFVGEGPAESAIGLHTACLE